MNQEYGIDFLNCEERLANLAKCQEGHDTRHFYSWLDEIKRLLDKVESLQCCGNCKNNHITNIDTYCEITGEEVNSHKTCAKWKSDGLTTRRDRE